MEPPTPTPPPESPSHRSYFYVGGSYVDNNNENNTGERVMTGQMYVEQLTPLDGGPRRRPLPLVFIHGGGQTASNWLNTPDGRKGWASYFLDQGYVVYLVDSPTRGRSAWQPGSNPLIKISISFAEQRWTATADSKKWPQAHLHTQWPGPGREGDPIFDAYFASTVPYLADLDVEQRGMQAAGSALLDRIGPAILVTHSQGGPSGWLIADARPALVRAIVAIEPSGPPFAHTIQTGLVKRPYGIADVPLTYDPPAETGGAPLRTQTIASPGGDEGANPWILQAEPARKLVNLLRTPVVVVTAEASYHAPYDECTVRFLRQAGVDVDWVRLVDYGIRGNGHMMFMELNNLEISQLLESRIAKVA